MGIYILAAIYVWSLAGFLIETINYIFSKEFRAHINEAPLLKTLIYVFCGLPLTIMSIIKTASEMIKAQKSEKGRNSSEEE